MRFGRSGKLAPRFIGPFEILDRVGEVAYRLALPPQLSSVHNTFHILMLRKYEPDPSHVLDWTDLEVEEDVSYEERLIQILDTRSKCFGAKPFHWLKCFGGIMGWRRLHGSENKKSAQSIPSCSPLEVHSNFEDEILIRVGGCRDRAQFWPVFYFFSSLIALSAF